MTGLEHFREAERLAKRAADYQGLPSNDQIQHAQLAKVHATLALAAVTALNGAHGLPGKTYTAWHRAVAEPER